MPRAFNFDQFDLDIAIALGETAPDTQLENYTPYRPERPENQLTPEEFNRCNRLLGVQAVGSTVFPPHFKPRS